MEKHYVPIEPDQEAINRFLDIWEKVVNIALIEIRIPFLSNFIERYMTIKKINVSQDPIPLGWKVQMDDWNDMSEQNAKLIRNTNGRYYIDHKDGKYHIFASGD